MTAALIIAEGVTSGPRPLDPMREVGTIPALQRIISVFQRAGIGRIVLVCGPNAQKAEKIASHMQVECLRVPDGVEMLESVRAGLCYLTGKCGAALITPVDIPLFTANTVRALINAAAPAAVPVHNGRPGHPLYLNADCFPFIMDYEGEGGLAGAVRASGVTREEIPVRDEGVVVDIQKRADIGHLVARHDLIAPRPETRIRLVREKAFFGPGTQQLLRLTDETGSLRDACRRMGVSYSKGWNMISLMEQQLGYPILSSRQGGVTGGHSALTEEARALLVHYEAFLSEVREAVENIYKKHFTDFFTDEPTNT